MKTEERNWEWASRPSGKGFGKVEVYKRPLNEKEVKRRKEVKIISERPKGSTKTRSLSSIKRNEDNEDRKSTSGIYVIVCEAEKHAYVGQSKNMDGRLRNHKSVIQSNINPPKTYIKIREHYLKHGIEAFQFVSILPCPFASLRELLEKESQIMTEYARNGYMLYNTSINTIVSAETISCPIEYQPTIKHLIKTISNENIKRVEEFIYQISQMNQHQDVSSPKV